MFGEERKNGAFHADHRADEGVDDDQKGELRKVFAKTQLRSSFASDAAWRHYGHPIARFRSHPCRTDGQAATGDTPDDA